MRQIKPGMSLNEIRDIVHANAVNKGFWDEEHGDGRFLIHLERCHRELCEAGQLWDLHHEIDEIWYGNHYVPGIPKPEGVAVELVDALIRILDICGRYDIDVEAILIEKHAYNLTRDRLHGKRG